MIPYIHMKASLHVRIVKKVLKQKEIWKGMKKTHLRDKKFECKHCGKKFLESRGLKDHETVHSGQKAVKCEFCDKGFNRLLKLSTHYENEHIKEKKTINVNFVINVLVAQMP